MRVSRQIERVVIISFFVALIVSALSLVYNYVSLYKEFRSNVSLYKELKISTNYYIYNQFDDSNIYVLSLTKLSDSLLYKSYYDSLESGNICKPQFKINSFYVGNNFYIKKETSDSTIVTAYTFDTICWCSTKEFVYTKLLHPRDSVKGEIKLIIDSIVSESNKATDGPACGDMRLPDFIIKLWD